LRICSLFLNIHLFILDQEIHLSAHIPEAINQGFQFVQCLAAFVSFALSRERTDRSDTAQQLTCGIIGGMDEDSLTAQPRWHTNLLAMLGVALLVQLISPFGNTAQPRYIVTPRQFNRIAD